VTNNVTSVQLSITAISAGYEHTCALNLFGVAFCWGDNTDGDLGDGTMNPSATPLVVTGGHHFDAISAGYDHTCAIGGTGSDTGKLFCWATTHKANWEWTTAKTSPYETQPTQVFASSSAFGSFRFTSVSAGYQRTCAVHDQHVGFCWGYNGDGLLGVGAPASVNPVLFPLQVTNQQQTARFTFMSIDVSENLISAQICGLTTAQQIWCCGDRKSPPQAVGLAPRR
jgi:alpha-tubulin suppressor-like RCC1 family protein